jgi:transposase-like protein
MTATPDSPDSPIQRQRYPARLRAEILEELQRSGLSVAKFAVQRRIATSTLHAWRRKAGGLDGKTRRRSGSARLNKTFRQVPLGQVLGSSSWVGEIQLADGTAVRWSVQMAPELLHQLLARLRKAC